MGQNPPTWQNAEIRFPIFSPSGQTKADELFTSMKRHWRASNFNSESIMLDRAHAAKTFPDLNMTSEKTGPKWQASTNYNACEH